MKVIDILNKIANGEEGRFVVKQTGDIYNFTKDRYLYCETHKEDVEWFIDEDWLNYEVEIIEDKKIPEKLESYISCGWNGTCKDLKREDLFNDLEKIGNKINEIIDYINKEKE